MKTVQLGKERKVSVKDEMEEVLWKDLDYIRRLLVG